MIEVELNIEDYYFDEKPGISFSIDAVVSICIETDITAIDYGDAFAFKDDDELDIEEAAKGIDDKIDDLFIKMALESEEHKEYESELYYSDMMHATRGWSE